jgi:hypothetical protein
LGLAALSAWCTRIRSTLELALGLCLVHLLAHLLLAHLLLAHLLLANLLLAHLLVHLLLVHLLAHGVLLLVGTTSGAESAVLLRRLLSLCAGLAEARVAHVGDSRLMEVDTS